MSDKLNVIFVCGGNSCRSQMAEGWARELHGERLNPFSAGIEPRRLDPLAVKVMAEAGVDISTQEAHAVQDFLHKDLDVTVTVCNEAMAERCPAFPANVKVINHPFDDPPTLTEEIVGEEKLNVYRRVRDEIRDFVQKLPGRLEKR